MLAKLGMNTKQTPFRLTPEDLSLLDAVISHVGVRSRSEALRVVLRSYARTEGIRLKQSPNQPIKSGKASR
jgi:hypothetical protein